MDLDTEDYVNSENILDGNSQFAVKIDIVDESGMLIISKGTIIPPEDSTKVKEKLKRYRLKEKLANCLALSENDYLTSQDFSNALSNVINQHFSSSSLKYVEESLNAVENVFSKAKSNESFQIHLKILQNNADKFSYGLLSTLIIQIIEESNTNKNSSDSSHSSDLSIASLLYQSGMFYVRHNNQAFEDLDPVSDEDWKRIIIYPEVNSKLFSEQKSILNGYKFSEEVISTLKNHRLFLNGEGYPTASNIPPNDNAMAINCVSSSLGMIKKGFSIQEIEEVFKIYTDGNCPLVSSNFLDSFFPLLKNIDMPSATKPKEVNLEILETNLVKYFEQFHNGVIKIQNSGKSLISDIVKKDENSVQHFRRAFENVSLIGQYNIGNIKKDLNDKSKHTFLLKFYHTMERVSLSLENSFLKLNQIHGSEFEEIGKDINFLRKDLRKFQNEYLNSYDIKPLILYGF